MSIHDPVEVLNARLAEIARSPVLLVATDFDGTLAPLVDDPGQARPERGSVAALTVLSKIPDTHVAIISGRALADLASFADDCRHFHLVGSHGAETADGVSPSMDACGQSLLDQISAEVEQIARSFPGCRCERKPTGIALHYRNACERSAIWAVEVVRNGPARNPGVLVRTGKKVMDLSVLAVNKGDAVRTLRDQLGATAVLFMGDDDTDEDAFATLTAQDVGIKVGPGQSRALHRIPDTIDVVLLLSALGHKRAEWLSQSRGSAWSTHQESA